MPPARGMRKFVDSWLRALFLSGAATSLENSPVYTQPSDAGSAYYASPGVLVSQFYCLGIWESLLFALPSGGGQDSGHQFVLLAAHSAGGMGRSGNPLVRPLPGAPFFLGCFVWFSVSCSLFGGFEGEPRKHTHRIPPMYLALNEDPQTTRLGQCGTAGLRFARVRGSTDVS